MLLIAGASDQGWQCEQAEGDHSQSHGNEIQGNVGVYPIDFAQACILRTTRFPL
jgi:hypothetical protein